MLKNMKIGVRLAIGFSIVLMIVVLIGAVGYWNIASMFTTSMDIIKVDAHIAEGAARLRANILNLRRSEKDVFLNIGSGQKDDEYYKQWKDKVELYDQRIADMEKVARDEKDKEILKELKTEIAAYTAGFNESYRLIQEGKITTPQQGNASMANVKDLVHKLEQKSADFADEAKKRMEPKIALMNDIKRRTTMVMALFVAIAAFFSVLVGIIITRSITRPISSAL